MVQEKAFPEEFYQSRFDGIQTLRGISAVLIVMHHMRFLHVVLLESIFFSTSAAL
ncbi:MAG: hypothetical protein LUI39_03180 [Lachnospiraceae bacterium]|nr:hypothetical protein [Lachnospiraceae bacterium]